MIAFHIPDGAFKAKNNFSSLRFSCFSFFWSNKLFFHCILRFFFVEREINWKTPFSYQLKVSYRANPWRNRSVRITKSFHNLLLPQKNVQAEKFRIALEALEVLLVNLTFDRSSSKRWEIRVSSSCLDLMFIYAGNNEGKEKGRARF